MRIMKQKSSQDYKTILVIALGFLCLSYSFKNDWLLLVAFSIGSVSVLSNKVTALIVWSWFKLSELLGYIVPNLILGMVYYLFLTPIALFSRIQNKKKTPSVISSNFQDVNKSYSDKDLLNTW